MSEIQEVLAAIAAMAERNEPMALATIVATRGSTYRRAGARYLVPATGEPIGNLSGGCLEDDVARAGREVIASGEPRLMTFDMTADGEEVWGYGLGCNGAIDVFLEPGGMAVETASAFHAAIEENRPAALVTVIEADDPGVLLGARLLVEPLSTRRSRHVPECRQALFGFGVNGLRRLFARLIGHWPGISNSQTDILLKAHSVQNTQGRDRKCWHCVNGSRRIQAD